MAATEHSMHIFLAAIVLAVLAACGRGAADERHVSWPLEGDFLGKAEVTIRPPEGSWQRDAGSASARIEKLEDGKVRLAVSGSIKQEGDAGFVLDGDLDAQGWWAGQDGIEVRISEDGALKGGGRLGTQQYRLQGKVDDRRIDLVTEIVLRQDSAGGFPTGTRFEFRYAMERVAPPGEAAGAEDEQVVAARSQSAEGCRRVEWRLRNVPNFSGGAMSLVRVPVCVE
jgi:hypothetical protein